MADDDNNNNNNNNAYYNDGEENDDVWALFNQKDERACKVYDGNDFFTVFVQILLAIAALLSLYLKRMKEVPRRTFSTWAMDVSKQGVGACYAHVCNMVRVGGVYSCPFALFIFSSLRCTIIYQTY